MWRCAGADTQKGGFGEGLCGVSFNLSSMERGELGQGRCMVLLLAKSMQDIGCSQTECEGRDCTLKSGVWWLREAGMGHTEVGGGRVDERGLWEGYSSNSHINPPKTSYCRSQRVYVGYG